MMKLVINKLMRSVFQSLFLAFILVGISYAQPTSVFVTAHPDDWQLFMNPNAFHAVSDSNQHVIFLHITAGDAGHGMEYNNFTLAREEGSKRALRFLINAAYPRENFKDSATDTTMVINGYKINFYQYRNISSYFLRLPDGNYDGGGYVRHNKESVAKILSGEKLTINSIDKQNTFTREGILETIGQIIPAPSLEHPIHIHIAETDSTINPDDHSDHIASAKLILEIMEDKKPYQLYKYIEYYTNSLPMNVFPLEYQVSVGTWGATISGISDFGHYSTWDETHNSWLGRQYYARSTVSNESMKE